MKKYLIVFMVVLCGCATDPNASLIKHYRGTTMEQWAIEEVAILARRRCETGCERKCFYKCSKYDPRIREFCQCGTIKELELGVGTHAYFDKGFWRCDICGKRIK